MASDLLIQLNMLHDKDKKFWYGLSPWIFIGAVAILFPIFALMTAESISRLKKNTSRLLLEKGAALIRSFEAGTRSGMMMHAGRGPGKFRLQHLLTETAKQPDIVHILVTDLKGRIVAHGDPTRIGEIYSEKLDLEDIFTLNGVQWRIVSKPGSPQIFEVFRKFSPPHGPIGEFLSLMPPMPDHPPDKHHRETCDPQDCAQGRWIIFVGLDMSSVEEIRREETRQVVIIGIIFLVIGFAGVILLFVVQNHRLSEIRELKKEVIKNQRLASLGMLAAGVAHEIRNPLSSVKGFATYFKERYQHIPEDQYIADIMIQEVDRLNRVVTQLLEFARPIRIFKKLVCINTLVQDSLKLIERQANDKGIEIRLLLMLQPEQISVDSDKISQVLLNLYLNAIEAMNTGGILSVSVFRDKKGIAIRVADNGCGIAPQDLAHVFDPYFTTKSTGTGLGLAIVNNIVEAHEGHIRIESQSGQGTTVEFRLPSL